MSVTLRTAVPEDAPAIARICLSAGGGSFEYLFNRLQPNTNAEQVLTRLAALETTPYSYRHFTVAESNGDVVGGANAVSMPALSKAEEQTLPALKQHAGLSPMALIRYAIRRIRLATRVRGEPIDPGTLILANIAVFPGHTGEGIGAALVQHVLARARQDGYPAVSLVVWESNERARALYERNGFRSVYTTRFKALGSLPERARCLMVCDLP
jgi:ribosomal protein S18 acetylase RimI-like enzyme